jgi:hypothetical protein
MSERSWEAATDTDNGWFGGDWLCLQADATTIPLLGLVARSSLQEWIADDSKHSTLQTIEHELF